eukprot:57528_1
MFAVHSALIVSIVASICLFHVMATVQYHSITIDPSYPLRINDVIDITGDGYDATMNNNRWGVWFYVGSDAAFLFTPRCSDNIVVRNTMTNGNWQAEERSGGMQIPCTPTESQSLSFKLTATAWEVSSFGNILTDYDYNHRILPFDSITRISTDSIINPAIHIRRGSGSYYEHVEDQMNWAQAESHCQSVYGTHLATIWNDQAAEELLTLPTDVWIGINDLEVEGRYVYAGSLCGGSCGSNYKYWMQGQPNDHYGQDCGVVEVSRSTIEDMLHDGPCESTIAFACNKKQPSALIELLDNAIFAASSHHDDGLSPDHARRDSGSAWAASSNNQDDEYLQVDLGQYYSIVSVSVYPRCNINDPQYVTTYTLSYSLDGVEQANKKLANIYPHTLNGPQQCSGDDIRDELNSVLNAPVVARYLRFTPVSYVRHKSMRVEAYSFKVLLDLRQEDSITISASNQIDETVQMRDCMNYKFDLVINEWCGSPYIYCSIIHVGKDDTSAIELAQRMPAIWLTNVKLFHIAATTKSDQNPTQDVAPAAGLSLDTTYSFDITYDQPRARFKVTVNDETILDDPEWGAHCVSGETCHDVVVAEQVPIQIGPQWTPAASGSISKLLITDCTDNTIDLGDEVSGTINPYEIKFYRVVFSSDVQGTIVLNSCGSNFDTHISWYDSNMNELSENYSPNYVGEDCLHLHEDSTLAVAALLNDPVAGTYYAGIGGFSNRGGSYKLSLFSLVISFNDEVTDFSTGFGTMYYRVHFASNLQGMVAFLLYWSEAHDNDRHCEAEANGIDDSDYYTQLYWYDNDMTQLSKANHYDECHDPYYANLFIPNPGAD